MVDQLFRSDSNILLNSILYLADNTSVAQCTRTESKVIKNLNKVIRTSTATKDADDAKTLPSPHGLRNLGLGKPTALGI